MTPKRTPKSIDALRAELDALRGQKASPVLANLLADMIETIEALQKAVASLQRPAPQIGPIKDNVPWLGAQATPAEIALLEYQMERGA